MPYLILIGLAAYVQVSLGTLHMMATIFLYPVIFLETRNLYDKVRVMLLSFRAIPAVVSQDHQGQELESVTLYGEWIPGNLAQISEQERVDPMIGDVLSLPKPWIDHRAHATCRS